MVAGRMKLLAVSWAMPPLVYPRSIQISRLLKALTRHGWRSTVITLLPAADQNAIRDAAFAAIYAEDYQRITVDPREDIAPSPLWLRGWRRVRVPRDVEADNWVRRVYAQVLQELEREPYDALVTFAQPWIDHLIGLRVQ